MNSKRLIQELKKYNSERDSLAKNGLLELYPLDEENLTQDWRALITTKTQDGQDSFSEGPGNIYQDIVWVLDIKISDNYPSKPPIIQFHKSLKAPKVPRVAAKLQDATNMKLVYSVPPPHSNINFETGEICLDVLSKEWTPLWSLSSTCIAIILLLQQGDESSPLNIDVLNLCKCKDWSAMRGLVDYYKGLHGVDIK